MTTPKHRRTGWPELDRPTILRPKHRGEPRTCGTCDRPEDDHVERHHVADDNGNAYSWAAITHPFTHPEYES